MSEDTMRSHGSQRSAYRVPTLHRYGGMGELTAAGTAGVTENNPGANPNRVDPRP